MPSGVGVECAEVEDILKEYGQPFVERHIAEPAGDMGNMGVIWIVGRQRQRGVGLHDVLAVCQEELFASWSTSDREMAIFCCEPEKGYTFTAVAFHEEASLCEECVYEMFCYVRVVIFGLLVASVNASLGCFEF